MLSTPILLICFNRPKHTKRVLESILGAKPKELYLFQDGRRENNSDDLVRSAEVRQVIEDLTKNSEVVVNTKYSDVNLGCGAGPVAGISWFFDNVEKGIVMEDDCLPHPDFYGYCEELLDRYEDDERVRFINATLYDERWKCEGSYGFSHYMVTGAWAGWRRTWQGFDLDLEGLDAKAFRKHVLRLTSNRAEANWWYSIVSEIQHDKSKKSYWDYQMQIKLFRESALTVHPQRNLVSNIGFDCEGTHTLNNIGNRGNRPVYPILPLTHPAAVSVDKQKDSVCWAKAISKGWIKDTMNYFYETLLWSDGIGHKLLMKYKKLRGKGVNTRKV